MDNIEHIDDIETSDDIKKFLKYIEDVENVSTLSSPSIILRSWICMRKRAVWYRKWPRSLHDLSI